MLKLGAQIELRDRNRVIEALMVNINVLIALAWVFQVPDCPMYVINGILCKPASFTVPLKTRQNCTDVELSRSYMGKRCLVFDI